jgi:SprT protein
MRKNKQGKEVLENYLPGNSFSILLPFIAEQNLTFKVTRGRVTKLGDFRSTSGSIHSPQISINGNLNPYSFLITLLHETAHFLVWKDGHNYARPHGRSWKIRFAELMNVMITAGIFSEQLVPFLQKHLRNPKASCCSDPALYKELSKFDAEKPGIYIDDLPENTFFETSKGKIFKKIKKIKTRSLCKHFPSEKKYLFSPIYRVFPIKDR